MSDKMLLKLKRFFRLNMVVGLIATGIATYFIITGQYDGIESRKITESILGWTAALGLIYSVGFWLACMFRSQLFQEDSEE